MRTRRLPALLVGALLGVLAGLLVARWQARQRDARHGAPGRTEDADIERLVSSVERSGTPEDRGSAPAYGLDLDKLRETSELEPTVEYLTYVQSRRGSSTHLLFVRHDDLDALAELEGQSVEAFLERLDQLGVVVSRN